MSPHRRASRGLAENTAQRHTALHVAAGTDCEHGKLRAHIVQGREKQCVEQDVVPC